MTLLFILTTILQINYYRHLTDDESVVRRLSDLSISLTLK